MARTTTTRLGSTIPRTRADLDCGPLEFRSLGEYMQLVAHGATIDDQRTRNERLGVLTRTMSGISGTVGGFGVKPEWADSVFDQARQIDGPFARCQFRSCQAREFQWPIFGGSTRTNGNRWGGMSAAWGLSEIADLSIQGRISTSTRQRRVFAPALRDLFRPDQQKTYLADSMLIALALDYAARAEIRYALEYAMINGRGGYSTAGPGSIAGPQGVIGAGAPSRSPKGATGSNAISAINIDAMWGAIASGNKRNAVFHCNDNTLDAIDQLAVSGQWSESIYIAAGRYGNEYPFIKGKPVICSEACPGDRQSRGPYLRRLDRLLGVFSISPSRPIPGLRSA